MNVDHDGLTRYLAADADRPAPAALASLTRALQARFGDALAVILFYGSSLRTGDIADSVIDLHVIIDDYRAYGSPVLSALNRVLAPNVFYLATTAGEQELRCKYNVFGLHHLPALVATDRLAVFTWARFAQRSAVLYARDPVALSRVHALRAQAVRTFAAAVAAAGADTRDAAEFWRTALGLTFGCELRAESPRRAAELVARDLDYFQAVTSALQLPAPGAARFSARASWWLRRAVGKCGSLLRLLKGGYTFDGGLDYLVWKLERHSGRQIDVPERVRRRPVLHIWGFAWRLYRDGVFR
ncbi:MAG: hypothetical protein JSV45_00720 [Chromatiales bacterium]|nr:MAG: hypothetical protein JSV45_00720 [Chromatiales bacterium]